MACWLWARWLWKREIYNGENLFGEDQLVFARHPEQVALAGMVDFDGTVASQDVAAIDAWPKGCVVAGRGGLWSFGLGVHREPKYKREWILLFGN
jgi:hypothetical protein